METCENCNSNISNGQVYCNKCGTKINSSLLDSYVTFYVDDKDFPSQLPVNPISFDYCYQIGATAFKNNNYYEALEYFKFAITFRDIDKKRLSEVYTDMGSIYRFTGKGYEKSLKFYELAISANPMNYAPYINLMSIKLSIDDNGVLEVFTRMGAVIPDISAKAFHLAGLACENLHHYEAAKNFYEKSITKGYPEAQNDLADVLKKIDKLKM